MYGDRSNFSISWGFALEFYSTPSKKFKWIYFIKKLEQYANYIDGPRLCNLKIIVIRSLIVYRFLEEG